MIVFKFPLKHTASYERLVPSSMSKNKNKVYILKMSLFNIAKLQWDHLLHGLDPVSLRISAPGRRVRQRDSWQTSHQPEGEDQADPSQMVVWLPGNKHLVQRWESGQTCARTFRSDTRLTAPAFANELDLTRRGTHTPHSGLLVIRMKRFSLNQALLHKMATGRPSC